MFGYDALLKHKQKAKIAPLKIWTGFFRPFLDPFKRFQRFGRQFSGATFKTLTIPTRKDARRRHRGSPQGGGVGGVSGRTTQVLGRREKPRFGCLDSGVLQFQRGEY